MAASRDRRASATELAAARKRILKRGGGVGIAVAAQRLGMSPGYVSRALRGVAIRSLSLSELRRMQKEANRVKVG